MLILSKNLNSSPILCFGEILWDCLPHGLFLGGAPFNVAYHLKQLGQEPIMLSALGNDWLGAQTLKRIRARGLSDKLIHIDDELPTGTVDAELDVSGNATYAFADPAAWDRLPDTATVHAANQQSIALIFGSLALRHDENRVVLKKLLAKKHGLRVFDVNLRPPYDNVPAVLELARQTDVLKLNASELLRLTDHAAVEDADANEALIRTKFIALGLLTGCHNICVTRGAHGALWLRDGHIFAANTPPITIRDTIGAGDAFTAALASGPLSPPPRNGSQKLLPRACALGAFVASQDGAQPAYDPQKVFASLP
ncbi:MAG: PfkB family carbohydrate kinase [Verrucomicrobiota bacterium]